jgi:hypothetical protein
MNDTFEEIIILKESCNFFDELVGFIISVSILTPAIELQNDIKATKWLPTEYLVIESGRAFCDFQLRVHPSEVLNLISRNIWPKKLQIIKVPFASKKEKHPIIIDCIKKVHGIIIQSSFSKYYENSKSSLEKKFGSKPENWPNVWLFARVVRNAFSHGGKIKILKPNAPKVIWRNLEYDFSSNGKNIMYTDMTAVELIFLMIEMDSLL